MLRIGEVSLPLDHDGPARRAEVLRRLGVATDDLRLLRVVRRSHDARKRTDIRRVYTVDVELANEAAVLRAARARFRTARFTRRPRTPATAAARCWRTSSRRAHRTTSRSTRNRASAHSDSSRSSNAFARRSSPWGASSGFGAASNRSTSAMDDAVLTAVETRTSSPVRMPRDEGFESVGLRGLYPAGEGAGCAGGILSAGIDGLAVADAIARSIACDASS